MTTHGNMQLGEEPLSQLPVCAKTQGNLHGMKLCPPIEVCSKRRAKKRVCEGHTITKISLTVTITFDAGSAG